MNSKFNQIAIALTVSTVVGFTALPAQSALLVSSGGDNSIKQYDETTGAYIRDFVTSGSGGLLDPQGLTLGANGNLFVSSFGTNSVKQYNGTTGEYVGDFVSSSSGLLAPRGLTFGRDGSLFVTTERIPGADAGFGAGPENTLSSGLLRYSGTNGEFLGSITTAISPNTAGSVPVAQDVVSGGPNDILFVSESRARSNPGFISGLDPITGNSVDGYSSANEVPGFDPNGLAISNNFLFFANGSQVGRADFTTRTSEAFFVARGSGGLSNAEDVAIGNNGNLFVTSSGTNSVKQYDGQTGAFLGDLVSSGSGGLSNPTYLTTANVPVPEPSSVLGVLAFGGLFAGGALRRKQVAKLQK